MATSSEESLEKLLKKDIINIVLSFQREMQSNTKIVEEVRKLNDKFTDLESQLLEKMLILYFNKESRRFRKTMLGKCPIFEERVLRSSRNTSLLNRMS